MVVSAHFHSPALSTQNAPLPSCLKNTIFFSLRPDPPKKKDLQANCLLDQVFSNGNKAIIFNPRRKTQEFPLQHLLKKMAIFSTHNFFNGFFLPKKIASPWGAWLCLFANIWGFYPPRDPPLDPPRGSGAPPRNGTPCKLSSEAGHKCIHTWFMYIYIYICIVYLFNTYESGLHIQGHASMYIYI